MKKPPETNNYWLCRNGVDVQGPYTLPQIQKMHGMDPFPAETPMKSEEAQEWSTIAHWIPSAKPTVIPQGPHATPLAEPSRTKLFVYLMVAVVVLAALAYWLTLK